MFGFVWFYIKGGRSDVPAEAGRREVYSTSVGLGLPTHGSAVLTGGEENAPVRVQRAQLELAGRARGSAQAAPAAESVERDRVKVPVSRCKYP